MACAALSMEKCAGLRCPKYDDIAASPPNHHFPHLARAALNANLQRTRAPNAQLLEVSAWQKRWSLRACQNRNKKAMRLGGASTITRGSIARRSISMRTTNYVIYVWQRVAQMHATMSTTTTSFLQSARALARATACGSRVAQKWNTCGFPELGRENQSLRDAYVVTNVSTDNHA